jgi:hypothetical protein
MLEKRRICQAGNGSTRPSQGSVIVQEMPTFLE